MIFSVKENVTALKGDKVKLSGKFLELGDVAPVVTVVAPDLQEKTIGGDSEKAHLIIAVPSLDTPVCDAEARRFNEAVASMENVEATIISMDLPFAMGNFCSTAGIEAITTASDFRNKAFARDYGVLIDNGPLQGLCARALYVISKDGRIVYKQIVPEITAEPDYAEALEAADGAANKGASCCGFCQ